MKKIKNLKPSQLDLNIKYRCPECGCEHWISLLEAKTKEFVIVCHCENLLKPKLISTIDIVYAEPEKVLHKDHKESNKVYESNLTSEDISQAAQTLVNYGFTKLEAKEMIDKNLKLQKVDSASALVKICISKFGETENA